MANCEAGAPGGELGHRIGNRRALVKQHQILARNIDERRTDQPFDGRFFGFGLRVDQDDPGIHLTGLIDALRLLEDHTQVE